MTKKPNNKLPRLTGTAVPVSALKTTESCGCGEFLDLIPFAEFCASCGLKLIQLLPVNDTGTESSPYSALSAFALNPIYLRLQALPEAKNFKSQITKLCKKHAEKSRFNYRELRRDKIDLLVKIFAEEADRLMEDASLNKWIKAHDWIIPYAVFMQTKRENFEASWKSWTDGSTDVAKFIQSEWKKAAKKKNHYFWAWLQMRLDGQFLEAANAVRKAGIILKGDIPIMMNEDSVDVWSCPEYFKMNLRAGAPADGFNPLGQNWGFPIYNWEKLKEDDYSWWKKRLANAAAYYGAYRIDHVLGFFRIWAVPEGERTAALGYTEPLVCFTAKELAALGFTPERIRWLSKPHVPTREIEAVNNNDYLGTHGLLHKIMDRIGEEEMWLFKKEIATDSDIMNADLPDAVKNRLCEFWRNRAIIEVSNGKYTPNWTYRDSTAWKSLSGEEQQQLETLFEEKHAKMEKLWEKQAKSILGELTSSVDMIPCAEDLGVNPESVPRVMKSLNILSLRVMRWSREWSEAGQPYVKPEDYPEVSVACNSVHDSSTIRGWWLDENAGKDFLRDFPAENGITPDGFDEKTAAFVLKTVARAKSAFCIHPLQDLLHLAPSYYDENPENERINIPGSVTEFNWTYRIPKTVAQLAKDKTLINAIKEITAAHR
ncbi:MAG: 4-alpha-glucanotransferase [Spirochaetaceae bacterium]|nr:4-alpha-glucanotransferase [Spirochaetaceae bacterium]